MDRHVRGVLFVDFVRMVRKELKHAVASLEDADRSFFDQRIDPSGWYPMASFERLGMLIVKELLGAELDAVRYWGRSQCEVVAAYVPDLLIPNAPDQSLGRLQAFASNLFDFDVLKVLQTTTQSATVRVALQLKPEAEQVAIWQAIGFFESLVTQSGGRAVSAALTERGWERPDGLSLVALRWETPLTVAVEPGHLQRAKVLVVDDERLVCSATQRALAKIAEVTCVLTAAEAIAALESERFDAVLSDYHMPDRDGLSLLQEVAARWPETRRLLHSASMPDEARVLQATGVLHSVLHKPAPLDVLRASVCRTK